jgi:hypothetical protein
MDDPSYRLQINLQPGTFLVIDNWRFLHGRAPYVGRRLLYGMYVDRTTWDAEHFALEVAERDGTLQHLDDLPADTRTSYTRLEDGTTTEYLAQGPLWGALVEPSVLVKQVFGLLRSMDGEHTRYCVSL